uniref:Secreted protein n=1 Tax=Arundo donax TaxID=35708 RepID=A0A0A9DX41_ARUDO
MWFILALADALCGAGQSLILVRVASCVGRLVLGLGEVRSYTRARGCDFSAAHVSLFFVEMGTGCCSFVSCVGQASENIRLACSGHVFL